MAVVAEGRSGRTYLGAGDVPADVPKPVESPTDRIPNNTRDFKTPLYGLTAWADLFTDRQLFALSTFSELLGELCSVVEDDARAAGLTDDRVGLTDGGTGVTAYADAMTTYLAFVIDKCADYWSSICSWHNGRQLVRNTFGRQAIPMVWDFAEANPFSGSSGNWLGQMNWVQKVVAASPDGGTGEVSQRDASTRIGDVFLPMVCTDPPYYDNISYADLSDFFYVWLRRNLKDVWPEEMATVLTPKSEELIANPYAGGIEGRREGTL